MHKFLPAVLLCGMLTGCAGMNSDFDCNKSATDQCLTMGQANSMATAGKNLDTLAAATGDTSAKKAASETLIAPANVPPVLKPLSASTLAGPKTIAPRPVMSASAQDDMIRTNTANPARVSYGTLPAPQRMATPGAVIADRVPDQTQRLWVAPWVDKDDAFHQPAIVVIVKDKSHWDQNYSVIGEGQ